MSKIVQCPACSTKLKLGEASARKSVIACPSCSQKIRMRSDDEPASKPRKPAARPKAPQKKRRPEETPEPRSRSRAKAKERSKPRSRPKPRDEFEDDYETEAYEAPPRARKKPTKRKKAAGGSGLKGGLIGAGIAIGLIGLIGGGWWALSGGDDTPTDGDTAVAQTDTTDGNSQPNAGGGTSSDPGSADQPSTAETPSTPVNPGNTNPGNTTPGNTNQQPNNPQPNRQPPVVAAAKGDILKYRWNAGEQHVYNYELVAEVEGKEKRYPGNVTLTVTRSRKPPADHDSTQTGTGTGFVITPDGYMLTCHHVTEGAKNIEVKLNGQTYTGRVVAQNQKNDLAIVKIDAQNLPFVPLANSDAVQLAQEVRAIGYPLTDLLGQDLKVTRGTVSGINMNDGQKRFQIDAAINPGNSGGPLFNDQGQVIGINSAKLLAGSSISSVGFSVPVNFAKSLLQKNNVRFTAKDGGQKLAGPALVNRVKSSIALLTVESRSKLFDQYTLSYTGSYKSPSSSSGGRTRMGIPRGPMGFSSSHTASRGKVVLDEFGDVQDYEDTAQLPYTTGSMALLMIHKLDPDGEKSWSHETNFQLTKPKQQSNSPFGVPRFRGGPFGRPQQREPDEVLMDGVEIYRYRIIESNDREVKISKDYELKTLDHPTKPYTKITGKGTITFDKAASLPRTMEYRQTYEHNSENVSVRVPMKITYRMQDPAILAKAKQDAADKAAKDKAAKEAQAAAEEAMTPEDRLKFYLAEIKAKRGDAVYAKLAAMDVIESKRKQVCDLLLPGLKGRRPNGNLVAAVGKWATPKAVTSMLALLKGLGDNDWPVGRSLITGLANTGDERVIEPIAQKFGARAHPWHDAAKAGLIKFGPKAEDAVLKLLKESPNGKACEVLGAIGTKKSKDTLTGLLAHRDYRVKKAATEALGKIVARGD